MSEIVAIDSPSAHEIDLSGPSASVAIPDLVSTFELLISLNIKPETENKGPFDISVNIEWDAFLKVIAEKLFVEHVNLTVTSFERHWLKPASGPWLPVQDENGLISMLKKVKAKSDPYMIVRMQMPIQRRVAKSSGNMWDMDDFNSDLESNPVRKKARVDDVLEDIVVQLTEKYLPGRCSLHPDFPCFHHRHQLRVCLIREDPILSPMFSASKALKRMTKAMPDIDTTDAATLNMLPPSQPSTSAQGQMDTVLFANFPFPQYPQMPFPQAYMPAPPFPGFGARVPYPGNPFSLFAPGPSTVSMPTNASCQSPPSLLPTVSCLIAEFCETYDLGDQTELRLEKLGFRFGDDLSSIKPEEYKEVGFKTLEWRRVLIAYRKLKQDTR